MGLQNIKQELEPSTRRNLLKTAAATLATGTVGCTQYPEGKNTLPPKGPGTQNGEEETQAPQGTENGDTSKEGANEDYEKLLEQHSDMFLIPENGEFADLDYLQRNSTTQDVDIPSQQLWENFWFGLIDYEEAEYFINGGHINNVYLAVQPKDDVNVISRAQEQAVETKGDKSDIHILERELTESVTQRTAVTEIGGMPSVMGHADFDAAEYARQIRSLHSEDRNMAEEHPEIWNAAVNNQKYDRVVLDYGDTLSYADGGDIEGIVGEISGMNWEEDTLIQHKFAVMEDGSVRTDVYDENPERI